jgi:hypothetical protein
MTQTHSISEILGSDERAVDFRSVANNLADQMIANHWHVDRMPWNDAPLFPIRPGVSASRSRRLARFYKSVVAVQTRAEEIAVSIARRLLIYADTEKLDVSYRRALSSLMNDEASHVATMVKLEFLADQQYPEIEARTEESPLFSALMPAIETLHPAVLAIFMASYEASVAIRSYAEEQTYKIESVLGAMAPRAAEDDGRHAKTLRIVAAEFLRKFRERYGDDEEGTSAAWREQILDPFRTYWTLMPAHEFYLAGNDPRQMQNVRKVVAHDNAIMQRILDFLAVSRAAQEYAHVPLTDVDSPSPAVSS